MGCSRLSQTDVWHHFWPCGGFLGTGFGTENFTRCMMYWHSSCLYFIQRNGQLVFVEFHIGDSGYCEAHHSSNCELMELKD
jgi:hypothetical protein